MADRAVAAGLLVLLALPGAAAGQDPTPEPVRGDDDPELADLLERVGDRVRRYYRDLEDLAWTTTVRHEVFERDWTPQEEPRDLIFDSIVVLEPPPDGVPVPFGVRERNDLTHVDGEPVEPGYELEREAFSGFPHTGFALGELLFLVPEFRANSNVVLSYAGRAELDGRLAWVIDVDRSPDEEPRIVWRGNNFRIHGVFPPSGRVWIDAESYDVLRHDSETERVTFRRMLILPGISYEWRSTTRYADVRFDDADAEYRVPQSYESVRILDGARFSPIVRNFVGFWHHRRFTGEVRLEPSQGLN